MEVEEARKILGPKYDVLPDSQIQWLITLYSKLAHVIVDEYTKDPKAYMKKIDDIMKSRINKERHLANKMPPKATLDQRVKRHAAHAIHCKCRPIPESIRKEIEKRVT